MKKWFSFMAVLSSALVAVGQASSDTAKMPQPEFMQYVYYYNSSGNKLTVLEKTEVEFKTKVKLGGFGGSSSSHVIAGEKSPVRLSLGNKMEFSYKANSNMGMSGDPGNMIRLYKFESKGGERVSMIQ